jgi:hypothetical protein
MFSSKKKDAAVRAGDDKPKIKIKVNRSSGTFHKGVNFKNWIF